MATMWSDAVGDVSAEPSMEEILSSIKRIIAEEEAPARRRPSRAQPMSAPLSEPVGFSDPDPDETDTDNDVLELSDPMPPAAKPRLEKAPAAPIAQPAPLPQPAPTAAAAQPASEPEPAADPILSPAAADATRGSLDALSRMLVRSEAPGAGDNTLEGLVREMLRPMLRDWLDRNLPDMVEAMVSREIARISGQGR